jgi:Complex 1 protein (LYR family)
MDTPFSYTHICAHCIVYFIFIQLYRDCLRLIKHVAPGHSRKAMALRQTVRMEFDKHREETNPQLVEYQKANAIRALSNYMLFESGSKDVRVKKAMEEYHTSSVEELKKGEKLKEEK